MAWTGTNWMWKSTNSILGPCHFTAHRIGFLLLLLFVVLFFWRQPNETQKWYIFIKFNSIINLFLVGDLSFFWLFTRVHNSLSFSKSHNSHQYFLSMCVCVSFFLFIHHFISVLFSFGRLKSSRITFEWVITSLTFQAWSRFSHCFLLFTLTKSHIRQYQHTESNLGKRLCETVFCHFIIIIKFEEKKLIQNRRNQSQQWNPKQNNVQTQHHTIMVSLSMEISIALFVQMISDWIDHWTFLTQYNRNEWGDKHKQTTV